MLGIHAWYPWTIAGRAGHCRASWALTRESVPGGTLVALSVCCSKSGYHQNHTTVFGLATSDALAGPYTLLPEPVLVPPRGAQTVFEDAQVFAWNGTVYVVTTDNFGTLTGLAGALALWKSADGIHFDSDDIELAAFLFPHYLPHYDPANVTRIYGGTPSPQRPKILLRVRTEQCCAWALFRVRAAPPIALVCDAATAARNDNASHRHRDRCRSHSQPSALPLRSHFIPPPPVTLYPFLALIGYVLLLQDGRPAFLYAASGWVYDGTARCESHVFRIDPTSR